jgi:hypothetical protein
LDVIFERLFRLVRQLRECIERNVTGDFKADQGLNVLLRFSDADRYRSARQRKPGHPFGDNVNVNDLALLSTPGTFLPGLCGPAVRHPLEPLAVRK